MEILERDDYLMMIEPKRDSTPPIDDDISALAQKVWSLARKGHSYRGVHTCFCGMRSDNYQWILPGGIITNSLLVHYVVYHRSEVPQSEIDKLRKVQEA